MDLLQLVALQVEFTEGREVTEGALLDTLYPGVIILTKMQDKYWNLENFKSGILIHIFAKYSPCLYLVPAEVQRLDPGGDHGVHLGDAQLPRHHVATEVQSRQVGEVVRAVLAQTRDGKVVPWQNQGPGERRLIRNVDYT